MTESTRTTVQVSAWACLVAGLLLFLSQTHSTGEAPETFKLILSSSVASIVGASLVLIAGATLLVLFLRERKKLLRHR